MSDTTKQERIEEFLRKSLLGDELINTQFHLFSSKSVSFGSAFKPRVLCANNILLAKSSKYFLDLSSSDINPSDSGSLIDITGDNDIPQHARIDDYGYGSDSDLDIDEDFRLVETAPEKGQSRVQPSKQTREDDELSDDGSESVTSDMFVLSPEAPGPDPLEALEAKKQENGSIASGETAVEEMHDKTALVKHASLHLRSLGSRHIFVKDTAFQTWYTLLNYLYTGRFNFLPLSSAGTSSQQNPSSTNALDGPKCSAKSMYRLASKVGVDDLRDEAFAYIRSNLTEHNILQELSCSLVSRHPSLLEMELDVLYSNIASPPVVAGFPALAQRIANGELPHGADVVIGIHTRLLKQRPLSAKEPSKPPEKSSHCSSSSDGLTRLAPSEAKPSVTSSAFSKSSAPKVPSTTMVGSVLTEPKSSIPSVTPFTFSKSSTPKVPSTAMIGSVPTESKRSIPSVTPSAFSKSSTPKMPSTTMINSVLTEPKPSSFGAVNSAPPNAPSIPLSAFAPPSPSTKYK